MKKQVLTLTLTDLSIGNRYVVRRAKHLNTHMKLERDGNYVWFLNENVIDFEQEVEKFFTDEKSRYSAKQNGQFWVNHDEVQKILVGKDISPRNYFEFEITEMSTNLDWPNEEEKAGRYTRPELGRSLNLGIVNGQVAGVYAIVKGVLRHIVNGRVRKETVGYIPEKMLWTIVPDEQQQLYTNSQSVAIVKDIKNCKNFDKTALYLKEGIYHDWQTVIDEIWPEGLSFNGSELNDEDSIDKAFQTKDKMGGKGELLTQAIFPQILAIGGAGDARGIDLITLDLNGNEIEDQRIEVKEPNFRVGVKSFQSCLTFTNNVINAFDELINLLKYTKQRKFEMFTSSYYLRHLSEWLLRMAIMTGKENFDYSDCDWIVKHIKGNDDYFEADVAWLYDVLCDEEDTLEIVEYLLSDYSDWIAYLEEEREMASFGELSRSRADLLWDMFNNIDIHGDTKNELLNNQEEIENQYFEAINPVTCFGNVNIMFVTSKGYILYTPKMLAEIVKSTKAGSITQGKASFDLSNLVE